MKQGVLNEKRPAKDITHKYILNYIVGTMRPISALITTYHISITNYITGS